MLKDQSLPLSLTLRDDKALTSLLALPSGTPAALRAIIDLMLDSLHPMFIAWGPDLRMVYNEAYATLLGERHPAALGSPIRDVWAHAWPAIEPHVQRTMEGQATWMEDLHIAVDAGGQLRDTWWTFSYSPLRDAEGVVTGLFCACNETTATVVARRDSLSERARLFDMTRDLFGVATLDGRLLSINPAWSRLLHKTEEQLLARPFSEIIHPDDLAATAAVVERLASGESVHQFHVRLVPADGEAVALAWSAVPDETPGSGIFYTVGRDITLDLKREEASRQAQKMEALGRLTGGIAHDFNNLLQAISGALELVRDAAGDNARVGRLAELGLSASERGARLTAQLLAFSRAQKLDRRSLAIGPLVSGMEDMFRRALGPMNQLTMDVAVSGAFVLADPTQLEMALLNLAINACEAMSGDGHLRVAVTRTAMTGDLDLTDGHYVEIEMRDDGHGMPKDVAEHAFEPFFTTREVGKGTGLGLSQVYGVAKQAGGIARIRATGTQGTSIVVLLPEVAAVAELIAVPQTGSAPVPVQRRVLVVDDDDNVRDLLVEGLRTLGCDVMAAANGFDALALFKEAEPDVVVVDFAMPGMNGAELAGHIRNLRPGQPIVLASGYSDSAAIEREAGPALPILRKPFRLAELQETIHVAMGGRAVGSA